MGHLRNLHIEDIKSASSVYRIYLDDHATESPREWTNLGKMVIWSNRRADPDQGVTWRTLRGDAVDALEKLPAVIDFGRRLTALQEELDSLYMSVSGDNDPVWFDDAFRAKIARLRDEAAAIRDDAAAEHKGDLPLVSDRLDEVLAAGANGGWINVEDDDFLPALRKASCAADSALADFEDISSWYDFSDREGAEEFFEKVADKLGWAWRAIDDGFTWATAPMIQAHFAQPDGADPTTTAWWQEHHAGKTPVEVAKYILKCEAETYQMWCDGDIFGWVRVPLVDFDEDRHPGEQIDSCWGYIGLDNVRDEVQSLADSDTEPPKPTQSLKLTLSVNVTDAVDAKVGASILSDLRRELERRSAPYRTEDDAVSTDLEFGELLEVSATKRLN